MSKSSYETIIVFSVTSGEEVLRELVEKFKTLIEANGTIDKVDEWGLRKLAYPINFQNEGFYVLFNYECEPEFPAELDRVIKITDGVLRSLIVKNS